MTTDKTPATLAVDVLAVIEDHVTYYEGLQRQARGEGNDHYADELDEESGTLNQLRLARAAVAELIEAAGVLSTYDSSEHEGTSLLCQKEMWDRFDAALARAKGESA